MTLKEIIMARYEVEYKIQSYKGVSLLEWAVRWFKTSNDDFYNLYGFNFNPHKYPYLYDIARKKVVKELKAGGPDAEL